MRLYAFDIDVNLFFIPSYIKMEKSTNKGWVEIEVDSKDFIKKNKEGKYRISKKSDNPFYHFRDDDIFINDFHQVINNWPETKGLSFDKFKESLLHGNKLSLITARGQSPDVIKSCLIQLILFQRETEYWGTVIDNVIDVVNSIDVYPVSSKSFNKKFGTDNEKYSVPYKKKLAFKDFLLKYYDNEPMSIGYSDDDPSNVDRIREIMEDELIEMCPQCHFVLYDTSDDAINKLPLTTKTYSQYIAD